MYLVLVDPEFIFIEIILSFSGSLLLGVCLHFLSGYSRILLMGDFNTDLIEQNVIRVRTSNFNVRIMQLDCITT